MGDKAEYNKLMMKVEVEDTQDERQGGPNKCGRKFIEYHMSQQRGPKQCATNAECAARIPKVDVKFKVYRLSDFNQVEGTIFVTFVLMLDWEDPSLAIGERDEKDTLVPDFYEHFWPKPDLERLTPDGIAEEPDYDTVPKYKPGKSGDKFGQHRASLTLKYSTKIYCRLDFRDYPFDHQAIEIQVKLLSVRLPGVRKGTRPLACHPTRWRSADGGHQLIKEADCLVEFELVRLCARSFSSDRGPFPEHVRGDKPEGREYLMELMRNGAPLNKSQLIGFPGYIEQLQARNEFTLFQKWKVEHPAKTEDEYTPLWSPRLDEITTLTSSEKSDIKAAGFSLTQLGSDVYNNRFFPRAFDVRLSKYINGNGEDTTKTVETALPLVAGRVQTLGESNPHIAPGMSVVCRVDDPKNPRRGENISSGTTVMKIDGTTLTLSHDATATTPDDPVILTFSHPDDQRVLEKIKVAAQERFQKLKKNPCFCNEDEMFLYKFPSSFSFSGSEKFNKLCCKEHNPKIKHNTKAYTNEIKKHRKHLDYSDTYVLQVVMVREPEAIIYNLVLALLVVDIMLSTAHGIPISSLADRLSVNVTLLLTAMAFKFVLGDTLPPTPYLTTMETYVFITFVVLFFQGITFWFTSDMMNYRCDFQNDAAKGGDDGADVDWWSGVPKGNSTNVFFDVSCETIHYFDRCILMLEAVLFIMKNAWFCMRIRNNSTTQIQQQTHFIDLTQLTEFMMPEELQWTDEKVNSTQRLIKRMASERNLRSQTSSISSISGETKSSQYAVNA